MNPPPSSPEETHFAGALAQPAAERSAYLDRACGADAELRRAVEELLAAHDAAGAFLAAPAVGGLAFTGRAAPQPEETPGAMIGR